LAWSYSHTHTRKPQAATHDRAGSGPGATSRARPRAERREDLGLGSGLVCPQRTWDCGLRAAGPGRPGPRGLATPNQQRRPSSSSSTGARTQNWPLATKCVCCLYIHVQNVVLGYRRQRGPSTQIVYTAPPDIEQLYCCTIYCIIASSISRP
jgi:hypothetical protein